jgi:hypothetical protein
MKVEPKKRSGKELLKRTVVIAAGVIIGIILGLYLVLAIT